jgi:four helix bundle suffix protein
MASGFWRCRNKKCCDFGCGKRIVGKPRSFGGWLLGLTQRMKTFANSAKLARARWSRISGSVSSTQTNYLLDQQFRRLERDFIHDGSLRERMTRVRLRQRRGGKPRRVQQGVRRPDP